MQKIWFRRKRYGWGWYPATWQGWTIMGIWIILVINIFNQIDRSAHSVSDTLLGFSIPGILLVILLIFICWGTGEKPKWSWGK